MWLRMFRLEDYSEIAMWTLCDWQNSDQKQADLPMEMKRSCDQPISFEKDGMGHEPELQEI